MVPYVRSRTNWRHTSASQRTQQACSQQPISLLWERDPRQLPGSAGGNAGTALPPGLPAAGTAAAPAPPSPRQQTAAGCSTQPAGRDAAPHGQQSSSSARRPGPPFVGLRRAERSGCTAGGRLPRAPPTPRGALRCPALPALPRGERTCTPLRSRGARSPQRDAASLPETLPSLTQETIPAAGRRRPSSPSSLAAAQLLGPQGPGQAEPPPEAPGVGAAAPCWVLEAPTCGAPPRGAPGLGGCTGSVPSTEMAKRASPEAPCASTLAVQQDRAILNYGGYPKKTFQIVLNICNRNVSPCSIQEGLMTSRDTQR
ncbi:wiskott-Aldrich syndrome protein homolog 1-like [Numida meleagris]|uniref:wiskott-Aldrich syndrome protein homolog 1-like n=1 Tax=Numida meleagris TaxID=8996 RepID=UPI000B3DDF86|nr:wiskott-Aldrich syndrome protein homolog 1-like [Numida meleagris]